MEPVGGELIEGGAQDRLLLRGRQLGESASDHLIEVGGSGSRERR